MYLLYYGFSQEPFHTTPDPEFLYLSPSHKEAIASIIYGVERRKGFVAVVGEVGVGKTTVLRSFLEKIDPEREKAIYLLNPRLTFTSLLKNILEEFGENTKDLQDDEMVRLLHEHLIEEYKQDRTVILLIDEAQNIPIPTLEQLRMLSNLETSMDKLLQIILIGQPELDAILQKHELRQLRQRIAIRATIRPLTEKESLAYILHRLERVLTKESPVFTRGALKLLIEQAGGIPRRINILCDNALITGFGAQQNPVTTNIIKEVIGDIDGKQRAFAVRWVPVVVCIAGVLALFIGWMLLSDGKRSLVESKIFSSSTDKTEHVTLSTQKGPPVLEASDSRPQSLSTQKAEEINRVNRDNGSQTSSSMPTQDLGERQQPQAVVTRAGDQTTSDLDSALTSFPVERDTVVKKIVTAGTHQPVSKIVKKGDTLSKLVEKVYGASSSARVKRVLQDNPHIRNPRKIFPGQEVVFPNLEPSGRN